MADGAALLADLVLPAKPIRQWVLSLPFALRFLLATDPNALTQVLGIVYRTISAYVLKSARLTRASGATGAVTLIQRFGSALNLNVHFHMLVLGGAYLVGTEPAVFRRIAPPSLAQLQRSWSGWSAASAAPSNAGASWPAMPKAVTPSSTRTPAARWASFVDGLTCSGGAGRGAMLCAVIPEASVGRFRRA